MAKIEIEGMVFYAYHGCFEEERTIGTRFEVSCELELDVSAAATSDDLSKTIDYQDVYTIVKKELNQSSYLLENIAFRIIKQLKSSYLSVNKAIVKISKLNPPLGGAIDRVSVTLSSEEV